ncbi:MAG: class I SAM-dependent methyltransferase [Coriobacteriia bacterium]|nr:class I SAM-dependent methyltransferase [Coriobacteriia bacterium]
MNAETIKILCALNNDFYRSHGASFAASRQHAWDGWQRCIETVCEGLGDCSALTVFDLACGNRRFETFLATALPEVARTFYAVDNCEEMATAYCPTSHYRHLDILDILQRNLPLNEQFEAPPCDLSVAFGFMHHVPTQAYREEVLRSLIAQTRPGGYAIVSFWQFLTNDRLRTKAQATHREALHTRPPILVPLDPAQLDDGDYLLGWQDTPGAYRYCHSFSEAEIDQLVSTAVSQTAVTPRATVVDRFTADGRTNNLNTYLILQVL